MNGTNNPAFIEANLGLVHACANRFRGKGIEYDDLYGAGCVGLVKAAAGFDEERGVRFSTYAVPVILGEIKRLFRDGGAVKVSRSLKELSMRVGRAREALIRTLGREPAVSELAEQLDLSIEQVAEALMVNLPPVSLTADEEEGTVQLDIPVETHEGEVVDMLSLKQAISTLEVRDRKLIVLRYFSNKTQVESAEVLGMTQVQVSRREKKILAELRGRLSE